MVARSNGGTNKLVWTALSVVATVLFAVGMFLLNGSASRAQITQTQLGTHSERITRAESRVDALERSLTDLTARLAAAEAKLDRMRNPRPWETPDARTRR
jgi:septal ring factor EnvC (AmiA/AmiB activator)